MTYRYARPVLKFGTSTLTGASGDLSLGRLADLVEQVAKLRQAGLEPIIVSSGAIAVGRHRLGMSLEHKDLSLKQVLAAVGQSRLMHLYDQFFGFHGITSAQVLLTRSDLSGRQGYLNARNTLMGLCRRGVVPVVNENDAVATEEIKLGDNDTLSALVAGLVDADVLVLASDIAGLYTADPFADPDARPIPEVLTITPQIEALAGANRPGLGTGGMTTKLAAAKIAAAGGTEVHIVDGRSPNVIGRVLGGERVGTRFQPAGAPLAGRKRWILSGAGARGVSVDDGATRALTTENASLLPAGIVEVTGSFDRGDSIDVTGPDGRRIARGIANYQAADVERIRGHQSGDIEQILGYGFGAYVVHRDDLVCFASEAAATNVR